jgi:hypothetical protein
MDGSAGRKWEALPSHCLLANLVVTLDAVLFTRRISEVTYSLGLEDLSYFPELFVIVGIPGR